MSYKLWVTAMLSVACTVGAALSAGAQTQPARSEAEFKNAGHQPLSAERVRQLLVGNTAHGVALKEVMGAPRGATWVVYYPDAKSKITKAINIKYPGTWWTEGSNLICGEQVGRTGVKANLCYTWYEQPGFYYVCLQPAGDCAVGISRIAPGNAEGL